jgi:glucose/arabinose dehydrogenase
LILVFPRHSQARDADSSNKGGVMKKVPVHQDSSVKSLTTAAGASSSPPAGVKLSPIAAALVLAGIGIAPTVAFGQAANPVCPSETVFFNPGNGEDIVVPKGFKIEVFAKGLNFPTDVAFLGDADNFRVLVLESGTGLPSRCNDNTKVPNVGKFATNNPFTPDLLIFNQHGQKVGGPLGKPTSTGGGFQPDGPAIGLSFEHGRRGGTLYATDSNQGARGAPGKGNNTSRIVTVNLNSGTVTPVITGLPTGDHPTEQILVKDGWLYWSQGSATNAGVTGRDNGAGGNQHDIACEQITLSGNVFNSGTADLGGTDIKTSGYSNFGVQRPGKVVPPFEDASSPGMCTGAVLRAKVSDPKHTIQPVAWGFRNPYGIRFSPKDHPLQGQLMISENGEDERGARPVNNSPDRLAIARQNPDGTPEFHGWPDRFGFLDSTQSVFNPIGGNGDDLCQHTPPGPCTPADIARIKAENIPVRHVFAFPPRPPVAPLALEPADVAAVGLDFVPKSFEGGVVKRHAVLVAREGDFGFSPENGKPGVGHDVELVNFTKPGDPNELQLSRFAFNCPAAAQGHDPDGSPTCSADTDQAFPGNLRGINRPTTIRFGPDGAAYLVDYGAVRDAGGSDPDSQFVNPADAPLVQIPGTGVIWKITRIGADRDHHYDDDDR